MIVNKCSVALSNDQVMLDQGYDKVTYTNAECQEEAEQVEDLNVVTVQSKIMTQNDADPFQLYQGEPRTKPVFTNRKSAGLLRDTIQAVTNSLIQVVVNYNDDGLQGLPIVSWFYTFIGTSIEVYESTEAALSLFSNEDGSLDEKAGFGHFSYEIK